MRTAQTAEILTAEHIDKTFMLKEGSLVQALSDVSIQLKTGTISALVGPDGAGKSTFIRLVCGLMQPDKGSLQVLGVDVVRQPQRVQNRISYMPQKFGLYEDLSVQENLDLYADLHNVPPEQRQSRFARLMEITDLKRFTCRLAGKLSGGMKQKLGLACTLVRSPDLLLLDEPSVGVDPLSRQELWEIIAQLIADEQLTVLLNTTYLDEAERCDQVYVLHQGKILAQGAPADISRKAEHCCFTITPPAGQPARLLQSALYQDLFTVDAVPQAGYIRLVRQLGHTDENTIRNLIGQASYQPVSTSLEDGFMTLLKAQHQSDNTVSRQTNPRKSQYSQTGEDVITVQDLVRTFGDFIAVNRTSFAVKKGEIFGLLGPNGAGKTTTFRMLCGLLPASGGQLNVAGVNLRTARASARKKIGYVAQKFSLYSNLTAKENLNFFGGAYGLFGRTLQKHVENIAHSFNLTDRLNQPGSQLPGGYKQRLAMAVGLLHQPDILFLDEPTSGTDPIARREFWLRITDLALSGTTIIITTHFMEEAEYCDRILIQDGGCMLALGTPDEVRQQAGSTADDPLTMEQAFIRIVQQGRERKAAQQKEEVAA